MSDSSESMAPLGVVTELREHPRRRGRYVVLVDGAERGAVSVEWLSELTLRPGARLTASSGAALEIAVRRTALLDRALDLLAHRARSAAELRRRLVRLDAAPEDVTWVVERLRAQGYIDDASFARQYARSRIVGRGVSRRRLQEELYRRGVPRDVALEAIEATAAEMELDEYAAARAAALKRLGSLRSLDATVARRRLHGFLARRGYEPETIGRVLRDVLRAGGDPDALPGDALPGDALPGDALPGDALPDEPPPGLDHEEGSADDDALAGDVPPGEAHRGGSRRLGGRSNPPGTE